MPWDSSGVPYLSIGRDSRRGGAVLCLHKVIYIIILMHEYQLSKSGNNIYIVAVMVELASCIPSVKGG